MKKILFVFSFGILTFLGIKFNNFYQVYKDITDIENSSLNKYIDLYHIKQGVIPTSLNDLKQFVKERDELLFKKLEELDVNYIHEGGSYKLYHNGFDCKNDYLLNEYSLNDVSFLKSILIQGDVLLNNYLRHNFDKKPNTIYKVGEKNLIEFDKININELYKRDLGCDKIKYIDAVNEYRVPKEVFQIEVRIANNIHFYSSNVSDKTKTILLNKLNSKKRGFNDGDVYVMSVVLSNIELFECLNNEVNVD